MSIEKSSAAEFLKGKDNKKKKKIVKLSKRSEKQMRVGEKPFSNNTASRLLLNHLKCSLHTFWICIEVGIKGKQELKHISIDL